MNRANELLQRLNRYGAQGDTLTVVLRYLLQQESKRAETSDGSIDWAAEPVTANEFFVRPVARQADDLYQRALAAFRTPSYAEMIASAPADMSYSEAYSYFAMAPRNSERPAGITIEAFAAEMATRYWNERREPATAVEPARMRRAYYGDGTLAGRVRSEVENPQAAAAQMLRLMEEAQGRLGRRVGTVQSAPVRSADGTAWNVTVGLNAPAADPVSVGYVADVTAEEPDHGE